MSDAEEAYPSDTEPVPGGYPCITQRGFQATFARPPVSESSDPRFHPIVVGLRKLVPRWDITDDPHRKLLYYVREDTFQGNTANVSKAEVALGQAVAEWNGVGFGVTFAPASDAASAHFHVVYKPNVNKNGKAFFPDVRGGLLELYDPGLAQTPAKLKNTLIHELGHILGLRHEHAIKGIPNRLSPEGNEPLLFGKANEFSIMSYDSDRSFQPSDKEGVKLFYAMKNTDLIGNTPIHDYTPLARGSAPPAADMNLDT